MKKLLILVILALAACVAYVAMAGDGAGAQQPPSLLDHYKCYQARHAKGSRRFVPQTVFLTDQFRHNAEVNVIKLNTHCPSAIQVIPTGGSAAGHSQDGLDCYTIRDAPRQARFTPQNIRVRDKLINDENQVLTVSKAQSLCVPTLKFPPTGGRNLLGGAFVCYQAKTAKGQPRFQQRNISIHDQLDDKDVRVIRPIAYCSLAEKKNEARPGRKNDDFESRHELNEFDLPFEDHISTIYATQQDNDPIISCKTDYTNSVWYLWTPQQLDKSLLIDTFGSTYDTVVAVFKADDGNLDEEVACRHFPGPNNSGAAGHFGPLQLDASLGTEYFILVGSNEGHGGKLKFHVDAKDDASNDTYANATTILNLQNYPYRFFDHVSTMNATAEGNDPADLSCTSGTPEYSNSVWYTYTPTKHEEVLFYTFDSSYDTVLAVYSGTKASPVEVACSDNYFDLLSSVVVVTLKANTTYHILVGSKGSSDGGKLKFTAALSDSLSSGQGAGVSQLGIPDNSLTCYQVRQARHRTQTDQVADQFSGEQDPWLLTIGGVDSICVPSTKDPCSGAAAYTNGFQGNVGSEWSDTSTDTTPVGGRRFLGQFADDDSVNLSLSDLPSHSSVTVCFDLFIINSMDGADNEGGGSFGPDVWDLSVKGGPTLLHTTFSNEDENPRNQNYPDSYPGAKHPPHTGAAEVDSLGFSGFGDSVYRLVFTFSHTDGSLQFNFSGSGLQDIGDESWGLDNVVVKVH